MQRQGVRRSSPAQHRGGRSSSPPVLPVRTIEHPIDKEVRLDPIGQEIVHEQRWLDYRQTYPGFADGTGAPELLVHSRNPGQLLGLPGGGAVDQRPTPALRAALASAAACASPRARAEKVGDVQKTASIPSQAAANEAGSWRKQSQDRRGGISAAFRCIVDGRIEAIGHAIACHVRDIGAGTWLAGNDMRDTNSCGLMLWNADDRHLLRRTGKCLQAARFPAR